MTHLNRSTCRRLQKLPQVPSVWEGDRRNFYENLPIEAEGFTPGPVPSLSHRDCIIWVDGSEGAVRAMDTVPEDTGPEAIVRTLLRAMEFPDTPTRPGRPQKIIVRDREIQFYLRGVLQDLDINVEYVPHLPLIDQLFQELPNELDARPPQLPPQYAEALLKLAQNLWKHAPWDICDESQIISLEINQWDVETLYVSVMGRGNQEYGILLYRSLDSLKAFRSAVLHRESIEQLEAAFLMQDCLFVTFEPNDLEDDEDEEFLSVSPLNWSEIEPGFGIVHPLEGLRPILYEEEALTMFVALAGLDRFFKRFGDRLLNSNNDLELTETCRIVLPPAAQHKPLSLNVKVSTLPSVTQELRQMIGATDDEEDDDDEELWDLELPLLRDDLVPEDSVRAFLMISWETIEQLRQKAEFYHAADQKIPKRGEGLPVILIQTSRSKAKTLIEGLEAAGGVEGIGFNPAEDSESGAEFEIGVLQTWDGDLHLFEEFADAPAYKALRQQWDEASQKTKGYCGLIIAMGARGASRGNPQLKDMLAFFEARSLTAEEIGLGTLQRMPFLS